MSQLVPMEEVVSLEETPSARVPGFEPGKASDVVRAISSGKGWVSACDTAQVDPVTAWKWRALNVDGFRFRLELAEKIRIERMFEELIEDIEALPNTMSGRMPIHIKARMDFLKAFASRLAPGKYSEKVRVQHQLVGAGGHDVPVAAVVMVPPKNDDTHLIEAEIIDG